MKHFVAIILFLGALPALAFANENVTTTSGGFPAVFYIRHTLKGPIGPTCLNSAMLATNGDEAQQTTGHLFATGDQDEDYDDVVRTCIGRWNMTLKDGTQNDEYYLELESDRGFVFSYGNKSTHGR